MQKQSEYLRLNYSHVAERAVYLYAQEVLTPEALQEQMLREREKYDVSEEKEQEFLTRLAQRICSRELCRAWYSANPRVRNCAFDNLRRYLERALLHSCYAQTLQQYVGAIDDVLHQALEELHRMQRQDKYAGPDDPAAFLRWTRTIAVRQAWIFLQKCQCDNSLSLDEQIELFMDQFVDKNNSDPLDYILMQELHQVLTEAILSLRNQRYREVLLYSYLAEVDERELARRLKVRVQDIYMWRCRALKALRNKPEVIRMLRSLLE